VTLSCRRVLLIAKKIRAIERKANALLILWTSFPYLLVSVFRCDCCPLSCMGEAAGHPGYRANSTGFQNRFDRFCTGIWLVSSA